MKLTSRTEYAILALIYLARHEKKGLIHGSEVAVKQSIPPRFLQQIFHLLVQEGYVKTVKGKAGGYGLAKSPKKITIAELVRLFDGPIAASRSVSKFFYEPTPIQKEKKVVSLLSELREITAKKLEATSLYDLV